MLCPEVIGRQAELGWLRGRLAELTSGRGGVVTVVGEAGAGKSRLVQEAMAVAGITALSGRAVPGDSPVPFRPLTEALLRAFRGRPLPDAHPTLAGFGGQLARLLPGWGSGEPADDSSVLLAEAVARLLCVLAEDRPHVLVLEDLHWSDPETLDVVAYLADALRDERVLVVCTSRPGGPATDVIEDVARRDPDSRLLVVRLEADEVRDMVSRCLDDPAPPAHLLDFVLAHSDGSPFLVEELLAGLVASGALTNERGRWEIAGALTPSVPHSLRDSIGRRLGALDGEARRVLTAAALLGRHFDWELLPGIAGVDGTRSVESLRAAVREQLIEADGDGFRFRHALTREAVLADLLPPERRDLATRAWPAIERAHPGLPGPWCMLAADLAEAAGDRPAAALRLAEAARRALASGALATAEAVARRALDLGGADLGAALDASEVLTHTLAAAGKPGEALSLGWTLARRLASIDAPAARRVDLLVALVRAGVAAGDLEVATTAVDEARQALAEGPPDPARAARVDAVAAEVALDRAHLDDAEVLCRRAIEVAEATAQPEVLCEALLVLGRVLRPSGKPSSVAMFQRAASVAEDAGLARWHLRAQQELALESFEEGATELERTRELAVRYGAHLTTTVMDLALADVALATFDRERCLVFAQACVEASRRYGLATEPVAQLWLAGGHALARDDQAMWAATDAALERDADDPRILGDLYGRVLAARAYVSDDLAALPGLWDTMMEHVRRAPPTTSVFPGRVGWVVSHAIADDDGGEHARGEFREMVGQVGLPLFAPVDGLVEAIVLGRCGEVARATELAEVAYEGLDRLPLGRGVIRPLTLLIAPVAISSGWGDPVRWLRASEAWFAERGHALLVRRARALLGEAGAPIPRRGRGDSEVPEALRALGVTSREMDVLTLVAEGRTNKEIAASLFLSPKTVERHLTSLFSRTGAPNRRALAEMGDAQRR